MNQIYQIFLEHVRHLRLINRLAIRDIQSKFRMHYLGVLWQFITPTVQIFVFWFIFGLGLRGGQPVGDTPFFVWLVVGLIPWFFINPSMTQGANSIYSRLNLVSKMKFPVSILPSVTLVSNSVTFLVMLVVLIVILLFNGFLPSLYYLQIPYYLLCTYTFVFSFALLFSTFTTIVRDIQSLLQTMMRMLFYLTPIFWDQSNFPAYLIPILKLNPLYYLITGFRNSFLYNVWFFEDLTLTMYFWLFTILMLFLGAIFHLKFRERFADYM